MVVALAEANRLVTLTGAGGSGKTRLAIASASALEPRYRDGVTFVALQDAVDRAAVASAIATALEVREHPDVDLEASIIARLREHHCLLLLDNFEQVLDAAPLVAGLMEADPSVGVLVTSRAPLRIGGEQEYAVEPLGEAAAVALFVERARSVRPDIDASMHADAITGIARRVDRLPLALELAAAQTRLLTPTSILERLDHSLAVLEQGARDAPSRQRTQRATLDWSHGLLQETGQRLFARLSVFAGGAGHSAPRSACAPTSMARPSMSSPASASWSSRASCAPTSGMERRHATRCTR